MIVGVDMQELIAQHDPGRVRPDDMILLMRQLRLPRGPLAGVPMPLRDDQVADIREMYRLKSRTERVYAEVLDGKARGGGKTAEKAGHAIAMMMLDGRRGGQVIGVAAKRDQARIMLDDAKAMVRMSSIGGLRLSDVVEVRRDHIRFAENDCIYRIVSADAGLEQGLDPFAVFFDELHAQPSRDLYDAMVTAMGKWPSSIIVSTTTAGLTKTGICWERYQVGRKTLGLPVEDDQVVEDPQMLLRWREPADPDCDVMDREAWEAANPGFPVMPSADYLERQARQLPENVFRRYHLNQWTSAVERWLPVVDWQACGLPPEIPEGSEVLVAVDAALKWDTFAVVIGWRDSGDVLHATVRVFEASEGPDGRRRAIDLVDVEGFILAMAGRYRIREMCGDPSLVTMLGQRLEERGISWEPFPQTDARMLYASATLQRLVVEHRLRHGNDPTFTAQMATTSVRPVADRGVRISKGRSGGTNDAVIALAMCAARLFPEDQEKPKRHFALLVGAGTGDD